MGSQVVVVVALLPPWESQVVALPVAVVVLRLLRLHLLRPHQHLVADPEDLAVVVAGQTRRPLRLAGWLRLRERRGLSPPAHSSETLRR